MRDFKIYILLITMMFSLNLKGETYQSETNIFELDTAKEAAASNAQKELKAETAVYPNKNLFPISLINLGSGKYFSKYAILVDKKNRTLTIWSTDSDGTPKLVEAYPTDMGRVSGNKQVLGDLKTPEGIYFFQTIYNKNQLNFNEYGQRAFTTNYPNLFDKRDRKTGSGIWLHAIPPTKTLFRGSRGCVVLRNNVITKLDDYISLKNTHFVIEDTVAYVAKEDISKTQKNLSAWLTSWVASWAKKDLESYMAHYNDGFYSQKMTKKRWRKHKGRLNEKYTFINVSFNDPVIYKHEDKMIIKFIQTYKSDAISDSGEKTLHLVSSGQENWEIIAETWRPLKKDFLSNYQKDNLTNVKNN